MLSLILLFAAGLSAIYILIYMGFVAPVYSIVDLIKREDISTFKKILWALFLLFFWGPSAFIYGYVCSINRFLRVGNNLALICILVSTVTIVRSFEALRDNSIKSVDSYIHELDSSQETRFANNHHALREHLSGMRQEISVYTWKDLLKWSKKSFNFGRRATFSKLLFL